MPIYGAAEQATVSRPSSCLGFVLSGMIKNGYPFGGFLLDSWLAIANLFLKSSMPKGRERKNVSMKKITMQIDGMMCGMCESHVNDAIRRAFSVKKVTSSHTKGETVILTEEEIPEEELKKAVGATGYEVKEIRSEDYKKRGLFGLRRRKE